HALWAGIADEKNARQSADRLMKPDMFNGWGIRTLSSIEKRYNPVGYHLGSVWPHDNSIISSGFRKYGYEKEAMQICNGMFRAAMFFEDYRLSELFSGFSREDFGVPVHYPVACRPQAWASGSLLYMMSDLLGLTPKGFERKLLIVRPSLPDFVESVEVNRLRIADAKVDLKYVRNPQGRPSVDVMNVEGKLDIIIQP
ncbi:MAG TPA: amylo-alpha-1,6-glucosidase, partial [Acidobacteriota bacterium]